MEEEDMAKEHGKSDGIDNIFPFGAQYLRGAMPEKQDWEKDFQQAAYMGLNTFRVWIVWSYYHPAVDIIKIDDLTYLLDLAYEKGLKLVFLFNLESAPAWLNKKYPEERYVSSDGIKLDFQAVANQPGGGWPGLCWDNPGVKKHAKEFVKEVVLNLKHHPALLLWECMNEPIHEPTRHGAYNGMADRKLFCYCESTQQKYHSWLARKYGQINRLNYAWGSAYGKFSEIMPPTFRNSYHDMMDWRLFTVDNLTELVKWRTELIKKFDSEHIVMSHCVGGGTLLSNFPCFANDDWKIAQVVDQYGLSSFPAEDYASSIVYCLNVDAIKTACKNGKVFWQAELKGNNYVGPLNRSIGMNPRYLSVWSWSAIARGAKGVLFWSYRPERQGNEDGDLGLTEVDGSMSPRTAQVSLDASLINRHRNMFLSAKPKLAEVGLLFSPRVYLLNWISKGDFNLAVNALKGYYRMIWEENISCDIVHEDMFDNLSMYKVLVLPFPIVLTEKAVEHVKGYVKNGGVLISDPMISGYDDRLMVSIKTPGMGLDEVFGGYKKTGQSVVDCGIESGNYSLIGANYLETYTPTTAKVIGKSVMSGKSEPAILSNSYGKGTAILFGSNISIPYSLDGQVLDIFERKTSKDKDIGKENKEYFVNLLKSSGIKPQVETNAQWVEVNRLTIDKGELLIILNHESISQDVDITMPYEIKEIVDLEDKPLSFSKDNFKVNMESLDVRKLVVIK